MSDMNRNDPCYCGSGQKYKKCHMASDRAAEQERREWVEAATWLRRDLIQYAKAERLAPAFNAGLALYWNNYYNADNAESMSMNEAFRYIDWFTFDYQHEGQPRLLATYYDEKYAELSQPQQRVLDSWLGSAAPALYELMAYNGQYLTLRHFMSDETFEVYESAGKGEVSVGDWLITRIVPVKDVLEFSTTAAYIPQAEFGDLKEQMETAYVAYQAEHSAGNLESFLRSHSYLPVHHALAQAVANGRPPVADKNPSRTDKATQIAAEQLHKLKARQARLSLRR